MSFAPICKRFPFRLVEQFTASRRGADIDGFRVTILCGGSQLGSDPHRLLRETFSLIRDCDSLRYRRVQTHVRDIFFGFLAQGVGLYHRLGKVCFIDPTKLRLDEDSSEAALNLACVLVHEATHGYLDGKRVLWTRQTYSRIEAICARETERFARRAGWAGKVADPTQIETLAALASSEKFALLKKWWEHLTQ